jgi:hypothetical protein
MITLLGAHESERPLTLEHGGLELMPNPVLERLVTANRSMRSASPLGTRESRLNLGITRC